MSWEYQRVINHDLTHIVISRGLPTHCDQPWLTDTLWSAVTYRHMRVSEGDQLWLTGTWEYRRVISRGLPAHESIRGWSAMAYRHIGLWILILIKCMWNKKNDAVFFWCWGKMLFKCRFTLLAVEYFMTGKFNSKSIWHNIWLNNW